MCGRTAELNFKIKGALSDISFKLIVILTKCVKSSSLAFLLKGSSSAAILVCEEMS